jgi:hypothetical protein
MPSSYYSMSPPSTTPLPSSTSTAPSSLVISDHHNSEEGELSEVDKGDLTALASNPPFTYVKENHGKSSRNRKKYTCPLSSCSFQTNVASMDVTSPRIIRAILEFTNRHTLDASLLYAINMGAHTNQRRRAI